MYLICQKISIWIRFYLEYTTFHMCVAHMHGCAFILSHCFLLSIPAPSDHDLMGVMMSRLTQLEKQVHLQTRQIIDKVTASNYSKVNFDHDYLMLLMVQPPFCNCSTFNKHCGLLINYHGGQTRVIHMQHIFVGKVLGYWAVIHNRNRLVS